MTWLQPPGWVHVMIKNTWADVSVDAQFTAGPVLPFAAQLKDGGHTLVLRVVSGEAPQPLVVSLVGSAAAAGPSYTQYTLSGDPGDDNTPSLPNRVVPVQSSVSIGAGATTINTTLPANSFAVLVVPLQ